MDYGPDRTRGELSVSCPVCLAKRGHQCVSLLRAPMGDIYHTGRKDKYYRRIQRLRAIRDAI
jgi:hypothetical protein